MHQKPRKTTESAVRYSVNILSMNARIFQRMYIPANEQRSEHLFIVLCAAKADNSEYFAVRKEKKIYLSIHFFYTSSIQFLPLVVHFPDFLLYPRFDLRECYGSCLNHKRKVSTSRLDDIVSVCPTVVVDIYIVGDFLHYCWGPTDSRTAASN